MNTTRWLLHSIRCAWYRWQARDALDGIEIAQVMQISERRRMEKALAREIEEQEAWARWRKAMRGVAE